MSTSFRRLHILSLSFFNWPGAASVWFSGDDGTSILTFWLSRPEELISAIRCELLSTSVSNSVLIIGIQHGIGYKTLNCQLAFHSLYHRLIKTKILLSC